MTPGRRGGGTGGIQTWQLGKWMGGRNGDVRAGVDFVRGGIGCMPVATPYFDLKKSGEKRLTWRRIGMDKAGRG